MFWIGVWRKLCLWQQNDKEMTVFLKLYHSESILFCLIAPFFLAIPIMLILLAFKFSFFVCFLLILFALILVLPWLLIPLWILKMKKVHWFTLIAWLLFNVGAISVYLLLFLRVTINRS